MKESKTLPQSAHLPQPAQPVQQARSGVEKEGTKAMDGTKRLSSEETLVLNKGNKQEPKKQKQARKTEGPKEVDGLQEENREIVSALEEYFVQDKDPHKEFQPKSGRNQSNHAALIEEANIAAQPVEPARSGVGTAGKEKVDSSSLALTIFLPASPASPSRATTKRARMASSGVPVFATSV